MQAPFSVSLERIMKEFALESLYLPGEPSDIQIGSVEINRPGLQLSGYFDYFDSDRIQILGKSEEGYLSQFGTDEYCEKVDEFMGKHPVAVIICRGLELPDLIIRSAEKFKVPLLRTKDPTSAFTSALISFLNVELAPRITRHGVLIEVYGEGVLILGESGVGKSETAIELVKRGHRLIADDAVEIRKVSSKTLVGNAPENIRHFIELRGIGIINARRIFGIGSVKQTEKIDMVIRLEQWDPERIYDRMGLDNEVTNILGIEVPSVTIPVKPGRNLAVIIEVAAMNNRQKKMGYNSARELLRRLGIESDLPENEKVEDDFNLF